MVNKIFVYLNFLFQRFLTSVLNVGFFLILINGGNPLFHDISLDLDHIVVKSKYNTLHNGSRMGPFYNI